MESQTVTIYFASPDKVLVHKNDYTIFGEQVILKDGQSIEDYKELTKKYHDSWLKEHVNENSG